LADRCDAWAPVSEEPSESLMSRFGSSSRYSSLIAALSAAPPLPMTNSEPAS
jgi:hypothetical protein